MVFEWDEQKRLANIKKHGIDLVRAQRVWDGFHITNRLSHEAEPRWVVVGLLDGREVAVIYTLRGKAIRLISARRARYDERKKYQTLYQEASRKNDR